MSIGATIRQLRKKQGLTLNQLAALIESDVGNLSRLERDVQGYTDAMLKKIAAALNVPVAALFVEDMDRIHETFGLPEGTFMRVRVVDDDDAEFVRIPLVKLCLSAGITSFQTEPDVSDGTTLSLSAAWVERNNFNTAHLIAIRVKGGSMEPTIYEGDTVVIHTADKRPVDGAVFAVNYEGESVIKRFSRDAGEWWLTSDNSDQRRYPRKICRGDSCLIIGRIVRKESDRI
jgi:phage repressor protein C with HTH and peptisase S24 domain